MWLGTGLSESKASLLTEIPPPSDLEGSVNPGYWAPYFLLCFQLLTIDWLFPQLSAQLLLTHLNKKAKNHVHKKPIGNPNALRVKPAHCPAVLEGSALQTGISSSREIRDYV